MTPLTPITPPAIAPPAAAYHHAVMVDPGARYLFSSGVVPVGRDGRVPESLVEQARTVWTNIGAILDEARMSTTDIVSVSTYVVPDQDLGAVMAARDEALDGHRAASTLLTVASLARPAWKLEIAIVAAA